LKVFLPSWQFHHPSPHPIATFSVLKTSILLKKVVPNPNPLKKLTHGEFQSKTPNKVAGILGACLNMKRRKHMDFYAKIAPLRVGVFLDEVHHISTELSSDCLEASTSKG